MELEAAIRSRRTHKAYGAEPVDRPTLEALFELARWAPNHHLTNPWRFRVLGPGALARLKEAAGPEAAGKLDRAPTLVAVSVVQAGEDPVQVLDHVLRGPAIGRDDEPRPVREGAVDQRPLPDCLGVEELRQVTEQVSELGERVDFLERLVAKQREAERLPPAR